VIRAAMDRAAAHGTQRLTGTWPGDEESKQKAKAG